MDTKLLGSILGSALVTAAAAWGVGISPARQSEDTAAQASAQCWEQLMACREALDACRSGR